MADSSFSESSGDEDKVTSDDEYQISSLSSEDESEEENGENASDRWACLYGTAVGIGRKMLLLCCSNSGQLAYALICELYFKFIYLSSILNLEMAQFLK